MSSSPAMRSTSEVRALAALITPTAPTPAITSASSSAIENELRRRRGA
jgi:hypothetical protein